MNAVTRLVTLLAALAPAAASPAPATAAPATAYAGRGDPAALPGTADRTVGGHVFTPGLLIRSPFTTTAFQADLLYGSGTATGPSYDSAGLAIGDRTYTFAAEGQSFGYEKKVAGDVSVGGGVVSQLYSGIDGPSVVVVGTEIGAGLFGRATAGRRFGAIQGALTFDASYGPRYGILVLEAIEYALQNRSLDEASAFSESNAWTLKPGVAAAFAPIPALGITASVDYQFVSLAKTGSARQNESGIDAAFAADLDFGTFTRAPVSAIAAFRMTAPIGNEGVSRVVNASVGAYYTGRPALALGLELGWQGFTVRSLDASATVAQIRVQYFW